MIEGSEKNTIPINNSIIEKREPSINHKIEQIEILLNQYKKIIKFVDRPIIVKFQLNPRLDRLDITQETYIEKAILIYRNVTDTISNGFSLKINSSEFDNSSYKEQMSAIQRKGEEIYLTRSGKIIKFERKGYIYSDIDQKIEQYFAQNIKNEDQNRAHTSEQFGILLANPIEILLVDCFSIYPDFENQVMFNLKYAISQALQENQSKDKILIKIIRILKNIDLNQKKEDDFLKEIAENPRNAQAHLDYANFLSIEMDDDKTAEEHFQLALKHGAANPKIHIGYAKHCFQEKRIDEAYKHLDLAIELEPENSETWEVIPGLWMHDDFKNAKTDDFNPDPIKMERYERYFRQAFQIVPNSAQLHGDYAFWLFWIKKERFGEIPQTIAHFEKAIELEPQNSGHYMNLLGLMDITRRQEYIPRIEQMYEDLLIKFPKDNGIIHMYLSFLRYSKQDYAKVEKLYMQMIENEPDNYGVYLSIADFYMSVKNDLEKAGLMLQEALDLANPKIKSEYNYIKTWWVSFQLLIGNIDEGLRELYTLEEFKKYDDMQMYIQFLHYVYGKTEEERTIALRKFKTMLIDYRKNNDLVWDRFYFGNHVENVKVHHHPDQKLLRTIKNVISGAMEPKKLDKFPIWANLEPWIEIETIKKEE